jgi:mRNA-degrading endonuclease YafQ of YafQ-DinJ toxin-antitoxin module
MRNIKPPRIEFTSFFNTQRRKLPLPIKIAFRETLDILLENPHHEVLRRHFLKEKYAGHQSIDITPDYRAIFKETRFETQVVIKFHIIGTHEELYGK